MLEHPEDPGMKPYCSSWITPQWLLLVSMFRGFACKFDQCMFGAPSRKPTMIGWAGDLHDDAKRVICTDFHTRCKHGSHNSKSGVNPATGLFYTAGMEQWPAPLCDTIAFHVVAAIKCALPISAAVERSVPDYQPLVSLDSRGIAKRGSSNASKTQHRSEQQSPCIPLYTPDLERAKALPGCLGRFQHLADGSRLRFQWSDAGGAGLGDGRLHPRP